MRLVSITSNGKAIGESTDTSTAINGARRLDPCGGCTRAGGSAGGVAFSATVKDAGKEIKTVSGAPDTELSLDLPNPKLWSPDHPFLVENTTDYAAFYDALIDRVLDFKSNFGLSAAV